MSNNIAKIISQRMTTAPVLIMLDRAETIITLYHHEFEYHMQFDEQEKNSLQAKVELTLGMSISMSPDRVVVLVKSSQVAFGGSGLWKD